MKIAVVLFNLGGPDSLEAVEPFLRNLFSDPAILSVPGPLRWLLARAITRRRADTARAIYARIGGASPLLGQTAMQAAELHERLARQLPEHHWQCLVAMRYWHPRADTVARQLAAWRPDRVILLPLYPQFSTTTSESSLREFHREAAACGLTAPMTSLCCWPTLDGWITAVADLLRPALAEAARHGRPRVLFSAHGLPKKVVAKGDPYAWQVERSAAAVVDRLGDAGLDWKVCYQSRVGPLEWLQPYTDDEIRRAGRDGVPLVVVPIAFVSEHSETLVELDMEYRELAHGAGVPHYGRVPTAGTHAAFVGGLAELVQVALAAEASPCHPADAPSCPADRRRCGRRLAV